MGPLKQLTDSGITWNNKKKTDRKRNALFYAIVRTMPGPRATQGKGLPNK